MKSYSPEAGDTPSRGHCKSRSNSRFLNVLSAFAVKVQIRIHRKDAKSCEDFAKKTLSCWQKIFAQVSVKFPKVRPRVGKTSVLQLEHKKMDRRVRLLLCSHDRNDILRHHD